MSYLGRMPASLIILTSCARDGGVLRTQADCLRICTQGPIALVSCASVNYYAPCGDCHDEATCAIRRAFTILRDQSTSVLDSISLAEGAGAKFVGFLQPYFSLQHKIAREIAAQVRATLSQGERVALESAKALRPNAYEHYLKGRYFSRQPTESCAREGVSSLEKAVARDGAHGACCHWSQAQGA